MEALRVLWGHPPHIRRNSLEILDNPLTRNLNLEGQNALKIQEKLKMFL